jgi:integrase/recombinase XerD
VPARARSKAIQSEQGRSDLIYIQIFKSPWSIADSPYPKKRYRLPTILSQEEVAQLIDAAPTPFYRTILMSLYGTSVRRTELTRLKVGDIDSRRMVVHIQGGKGGQDRDVMLSPVLLEELRAHWRRLREKSLWLFPGNRWHSGDHPMDDKTPYHACVAAARRAGIKKPIYPHVLRDRLGDPPTAMDQARRPWHEAPSTTHWLLLLGASA